jgi:hypothetical protein
MRGTFVDPTTRREVVYDSTLERDLAQILLAHRGIEELRKLFGEVEYVDRDGEIRIHATDFRTHPRNREHIKSLVDTLTLTVRPA